MMQAMYRIYDGHRYCRLVGGHSCLCTHSGGSGGFTRVVVPVVWRFFFFYAAVFSKAELSANITAAPIDVGSGLLPVVRAGALSQNIRPSRSQVIRFGWMALATSEENKGSSYRSMLHRTVKPCSHQR